MTDSVDWGYESDETDPELIMIAPIQGEPEEQDIEKIEPQVQFGPVEMVSDVENVIAGPQELGEYDDMDNVEVASPVSGPEDLETKMNEPQAEHEEQENVEESQGGFKFDSIP